MTGPIRITQYRQGAGCGGKNFPKMLDASQAGRGEWPAGARAACAALAVEIR